MDQEDSVQTGTPKERTGVSEKEVASPAVGAEPAFDLARSDTGSQAAATKVDYSISTPAEADLASSKLERLFDTPNPERSFETLVVIASKAYWMTKVGPKVQLRLFEPAGKSGNPTRPASLARGSNQIRQTTPSDSVLSGKEERPSIIGGIRLLNELEKSWLAGVIDGEGSIFLSKLTQGNWTYRRGFIYVASMSLSNSNEAFLRKVQEIIGKGSVNFCAEDREGWKDRWLYRCAGRVLRGLLPQLVPHLLIKKRNAEIMLQYLSFVDANPMDGRRRVIPAGYYETLDSLYLAIKKLNEKGRDTEPIEALLSQPSSLKRRGRGDRSTDCREMTDEECAWLAGVIDGEGSIFISKVTHPAYRRGYFYRPQIMVSNSNRSFLVRVMEVIGEGTVHIAERGEGNWKTRWEYQGTAGVMRQVLPQIIPYLIIKRVQAEEVLGYFDFIYGNPIIGMKEIPKEYYERLDGIYLSIKKLNEKGKPDSTD
jgi:hypothetical protein